MVNYLHEMDEEETFVIKLSCSETAAMLVVRLINMN